MKKKQDNSQIKINVSYTYKKATAICTRIRFHFEIHQCKIHLCHIRNTQKNNKPVEVSHILLCSVNLMLIKKKKRNRYPSFLDSKMCDYPCIFLSFFSWEPSIDNFFLFLFRLLKKISIESSKFIFAVLYQWYNISSLLTF